jgi:hypothetical protein
MTNFNKKLLILVLIISPLTIALMPTVKATESENSSNVLILYDITSDTCLKSESLLTDLLEQPDIDTISAGISTPQQLLLILSQMPSETDALVIIAHGTWMGLAFGTNLLLWEGLRDELEKNSVQKIVLLSCYSAIVPLGLPEELQGRYEAFETEIDYVIATYSGAEAIAEEFQNQELTDVIYTESSAIKDELIWRAAYSTEILWGGGAHNRIAQLAKEEIGSSTWSRMNSQTATQAIIADAADVADGVVYMSPSDVINDAGKRTLWLKHNYGMRLGMEIYTNILWYHVTLYNLNPFAGTAPESAQAAYDNAIYYYRPYSYLYYYRPADYVQAGKYLSYAIHYGQDMTMPYHVYDYGKLSIYVDPALAALTAISLILTLYDTINSLLAFPIHNQMESWVDQNINYVVNDYTTYTTYYYYGYYYTVSSVSRGVKYVALGSSYSIGSGSYAVRDAVRDIALWTRGHTPQIVADTFPLLNSANRRNMVIPLLAKAVDFSTALYLKFINEA